MAEHDYPKLCRESAAAFRKQIEALPPDTPMLWMLKEGFEGVARDYETMATVVERYVLKLDRCEELLATAYQLAGLVGAPVRFLDAYALHDDVDPDSLLPVTLDELDEFNALTSRLEKYRRHIENLLEIIDEHKVPMLDHEESCVRVAEYEAKGNDWPPPELRDVEILGNNSERPAGMPEDFDARTDGDGLGVHNRE